MKGSTAAISSLAICGAALSLARHEVPRWTGRERFGSFPRQSTSREHDEGIDNAAEQNGAETASFGASDGDEQRYPFFNRAQEVEFALAPTLSSLGQPSDTCPSFDAGSFEGARDSIASVLSESGCSKRFVARRYGSSKPFFTKENESPWSNGSANGMTFADNMSVPSFASVNEGPALARLSCSVSEAVGDGPWNRSGSCDTSA